MVDEHGDVRVAVVPLPKNITFDVVPVLAECVSVLPSPESLPWLLASNPGDFLGERG